MLSSPALIHLLPEQWTYKLSSACFCALSRQMRSIWMQLYTFDRIALFYVKQIVLFLDESTEFIFNGVSSRAVPPRMFCDICDQFDLHETEDCPTQVRWIIKSPPQIHKDFLFSISDYFLFRTVSNIIVLIADDPPGGAGADPHQDWRQAGGGAGVLRDLRDIRTQHRGVQRRRDLLDTFHLHCKHKCLICNVIFHDMNNFTHARHMYCI